MQSFCEKSQSLEISEFFQKKKSQSLEILEFQWHRLYKEFILK